MKPELHPLYSLKAITLLHVELVFQFISMKEPKFWKEFFLIYYLLCHFLLLFIMPSHLHQCSLIRSWSSYTTWWAFSLNTEFTQNEYRKLWNCSVPSVWRRPMFWRSTCPWVCPSCPSCSTSKPTWSSCPCSSARPPNPPAVAVAVAAPQLICASQCSLHIREQNQSSSDSFEDSKLFSLFFAQKRIP